MVSLSFGRNSSAPQQPKQSKQASIGEAISVAQELQACMDTLLSKLESDSPGYLQCTSIGLTSQQFTGKLRYGAKVTTDLAKPLSKDDAQNFLAEQKIILVKTRSIRERMLFLHDHFVKMSVAFLVKRDLVNQLDATRQFAREFVACFSDDEAMRAEAESLCQEITNILEEALTVYV